MVSPCVYELARNINVSKTFFYFAYGSNLCRPRLQARIGSSPVLGAAQLRKHRLAFHKNGQDGSAKCDAFHTDDKNDLLWGAVYEVTSRQKETLDIVEGVGNGYEVKTVEVELQKKAIEIILYAAQEDHIDNDLLPFDWYHAFVLHGARSHNLPADYVDAIQQVSVQSDRDRRRAAENKQILAIDSG